MRFGGQAVSLGGGVLRIETAAVAAVSAVMLARETPKDFRPGVPTDTMDRSRTPRIEGSEHG